MGSNDDDRTARRGARGVGALALAAAACALCTAAGSPRQGDAGARVDDARGAIERWVDVRRVLSKEKRDWDVGRRMLEERVALVQRELEALRERIAEAQAGIAAADAQRGELVERNERLKGLSESLESTLRGLEDRTAALLGRLPDPLRARVQPISQRLPDDPAQAKLSLGERFLTVVGLLNEANKFNREVAATSEVRKLGDGATAEVTTLYVGVGQAFYVSGDGLSAGVGLPADGGWSFRAANDAAPAIAQAIAILKNEQVADFVPLPVTIE